MFAWRESITWFWSCKFGKLANHNLQNDDGSKAVGRPREVSAVVPGDRLRKADLALRFLYPASLVLFNIVYWACVS